MSFDYPFSPFHQTSQSFQWEEDQSIDLFKNPYEEPLDVFSDQSEMFQYNPQIIFKELNLSEERETRNNKRVREEESFEELKKRNIESFVQNQINILPQNYMPFEQPALNNANYTIQNQTTSSQNTIPFEQPALNTNYTIQNHTTAPSQNLTLFQQSSNLNNNTALHIQTNMSLPQFIPFVQPPLNTTPKVHNQTTHLPQISFLQQQSLNTEDLLEPTQKPQNSALKDQLEKQKQYKAQIVRELSKQNKLFENIQQDWQRVNRELLEINKELSAKKIALIKIKQEATYSLAKNENNGK